MWPDDSSPPPPPHPFRSRPPLAKLPSTTPTVPGSAENEENEKEEVKADADDRTDSADRKVDRETAVAINAQLAHVLRASPEQCATAAKQCLEQLFAVLDRLASRAKHPLSSAPSLSSSSSSSALVPTDSAPTARVHRLSPVVRRMWLSALRLVALRRSEARGVGVGDDGERTDPIADTKVAGKSERSGGGGDGSSSSSGDDDDDDGDDDDAENVTVILERAADETTCAPDRATPLDDLVRDEIVRSVRALTRNAPGLDVCFAQTAVTVLETQTEERRDPSCSPHSRVGATVGRRQDDSGDSEAATAAAAIEGDEKIVEALSALRISSDAPEGDTGAVCHGDDDDDDDDVPLRSSFASGEVEATPSLESRTVVVTPTFVATSRFCRGTASDGGGGGGVVVASLSASETIPSSSSSLSSLPLVSVGPVRGDGDESSDESSGKDARPRSVHSRRRRDDDGDDKVVACRRVDCGTDRPSDGPGPVIVVTRSSRKRDYMRRGYQSKKSRRPTRRTALPPSQIRSGSRDRGRIGDSCGSRCGGGDDTSSVGDDTSSVGSGSNDALKKIADEEPTYADRKRAKITRPVAEPPADEKPYKVAVLKRADVRVARMTEDGVEAMTTTTATAEPERDTEGAPATTTASVASTSAPAVRDAAVKTEQDGCATHETRSIAACDTIDDMVTVVVHGPECATLAAATSACDTDPYVALTRQVANACHRKLGGYLAKHGLVSHANARLARFLAALVAFSFVRHRVGRHLRYDALAQLPTIGDTLTHLVSAKLVRALERHDAWLDATSGGGGGDGGDGDDNVSETHPYSGGDVHPIRDGETVAMRRWRAGAGAGTAAALPCLPPSCFDELISTDPSRAAAAARRIRDERLAQWHALNLDRYSATAASTLPTSPLPPPPPPPPSFLTPTLIGILATCMPRTDWSAVLKAGSSSSSASSASIAKLALPTCLVPASLVRYRVRRRLISFSAHLLPPSSSFFLSSSSSSSSSSPPPTSPSLPLPVSGVASHLAAAAPPSSASATVTPVRDKEWRVQRFMSDAELEAERLSSIVSFRRTPPPPPLLTDGVADNDSADSEDNGDDGGEKDDGSDCNDDAAKNATNGSSGGRCRRDRVADDLASALRHVSHIEVDVDCSTLGDVCTAASVADRDAGADARRRSEDRDAKRAGGAADGCHRSEPTATTTTAEEHAPLFGSSEFVHACRSEMMRAASVPRVPGRHPAATAETPDRGGAAAAAVATPSVSGKNVPKNFARKSDGGGGENYEPGPVSSAPASSSSSSSTDGGGKTKPESRRQRLRLALERKQEKKLAAERSQQEALLLCLSQPGVVDRIRAATEAHARAEPMPPGWMSPKDVRQQQHAERMRVADAQRAAREAQREENRRRDAAQRRCGEETRARRAQEKAARDETERLAAVASAVAATAVAKREEQRIRELAAAAAAAAATSERPPKSRECVQQRAPMRSSASATVPLAAHLLRPRPRARSPLDASSETPTVAPSASDGTAPRSSSAVAPRSVVPKSVVLVESPSPSVALATRSDEVRSAKIPRASSENSSRSEPQPPPPLHLPPPPPPPPAVARSGRTRRGRRTRKPEAKNASGSDAHGATPLRGDSDRDIDSKAAGVAVRLSPERQLLVSVSKLAETVPPPSPGGRAEIASAPRRIAGDPTPAPLSIVTKSPAPGGSLYVVVAAAADAHSRPPSVPTSVATELDAYCLQQGFAPPSSSPLMSPLSPPPPLLPLLSLLPPSRAFAPSFLSAPHSSTPTRPAYSSLHYEVLEHARRADLARRADAPAIEAVYRLVCERVQAVWGGGSNGGDAATERLKRVPAPSVEMHGSAATGLSLPTSDVDFVIASVRGDRRAISALAANLIECDAFRRVDARPAASVPVIKTSVVVLSPPPPPSPTPTTVRDGGRHPNARTFDVDLTFCESPTPSTRHSVAYVAELQREWPPLAPLVLVLKQLIVERNHSDVYRGGLGSYVLTLLAVAYLHHCRHAVAVVVDDDGSGDRADDTDLGVLLVGFLRHYAALDVGEFGVSVQRHEARLVPLVDRGLYRPSHGTFSATTSSRSQPLAYARPSFFLSTTSPPSSSSSLPSSSWPFPNVASHRLHRPLVVFDPFSGRKNIASSTFAFADIQATFRDAVRILTADAQPLSLPSLPLLSRLLSRMV